MSRYLHIIYSSIVFFFVGLNNLSGQDVVVAIDAEGKVDIIDQQIKSRLQLYKDKPGFVEARMFMTKDSTFYLEALYKFNNQLMKDKREFNKEQVNTFRDSITFLINSKLPDLTLNQEGRYLFVLSNTAVSLGFYGWALPTALKVSHDNAAVGLYCLTAGAGVIVPWVITQHKNISYAHTNLTFYGQSRGIVHGICLSYVLNDNPSIQSITALGMTASIAEGIGGYLYCDQQRLSNGSASLISNYGDMGLFYGLGLSHIIGTNSRGVALSALSGSMVGLGTGDMLARKGKYSVGDAYVVRASAGLGAMVPIAVLSLMDTQNPKSYTAGAMVGSFAGLILGHEVVKNTNYTFQQGLMLHMGTIAGSLVGLGAGYMFFKDNGKALITSSTLGAIAGYGGFLYGFKRNEDMQFSNLNIQLMPENLILQKQLRRYSPDTKIVLPVVSLTWKL